MRPAIAHLGVRINHERAFAAVVFLPLLLAASCATQKVGPPIAIRWPGSEVFMLPKEGGFQTETLELKDGRFRYWFSSDVILPDPRKYPIEGTYDFRGDRLILSEGKSWTVRQLKGVRSLWRPTAINYWDRNQVIDVYGILLPVRNIEAEKPSLEPVFTREQWDTSAKHVQQLEQKK